MVKEERVIYLLGVAAIMLLFATCVATAEEDHWVLTWSATNEDGSLGYAIIDANFADEAACEELKQRIALSNRDATVKCVPHSKIEGDTNGRKDTSRDEHQVRGEQEQQAHHRNRPQRGVWFVEESEDRPHRIYGRQQKTVRLEEQLVHDRSQRLQIS